MSRDFTPEEMLMVEKNGTPIIEFMKGLFWVQDGKKITMYTKEYIDICERFTYLGKLFDGFPRLYEDVCKFQAGEDVLKGIDAELKEYIENGKGDRESFVIKWFHGELDESFYYREQNNEMFFEKVLQEAKEKEIAFIESVELKTVLEKSGRMIKLYGGMTGEYEVFKTNAPDEIIIEQICKNNQMQENGECFENPYEVIESHGYSVDVIGCQDDDEIVEKITIDKEFDLYDYPPAEEKEMKSLDEKMAEAAERIGAVEGIQKKEKELERG